ncbi:MAG: divalent-cation tolerance protein CutA [Candidatus Anstonellaceae archaeon]
MQLLFTSFSTKKDAKKFAKQIIEKKLAGCSNYYKVFSCYFWNKKLVQEPEWILELKGKNLSKAFKYLEKNHPYTCPMIYIINVPKVEKKYLKWLGGE